MITQVHDCISIDATALHWVEECILITPQYISVTPHLFWEFRAPIDWHERHPNETRYDR